VAKTWEESQVKNRSIQCLLENRTWDKDYQNEQILTQIVWLPEEYAVKGKYLELRDSSNKEWINGWCVAQVFSKNVFDADWVRDRGSDHKKMKLITDI